METIAARVYETATAIGLPLDRDFSCVHRLENGTVRVVASADAFPTTEDERRISQSALHAALLEDLSDVPQLDVRVFVPPVAGGDVATATADATTPAPMTLASLRIRGWNKAVQDYATKATVQLAHNSYHCVVDSYPWLDADEMRARIPMAIQQTLNNMTTGSPDPLMTDRCVDLILPPLESILRSNETTLVYYDITRVLGGTPESILEFYEVLYLCVTHRVAVSDTTLVVYDRVFRR